MKLSFLALAAFFTATTVTANADFFARAAAPSSVAQSNSTAAPTMPDLSKLSPCALNCVLSTITSQKCKSPLDTSCICTADFTNAASQCLAAKCEPKDAVPSLELQKSMCPNLALPDLSTLSDCSLKCVIDTIGAAGCAGPMDTQCLCGLKFEAKVGVCVLKCGLKELPPALKLQFGICKPEATSKTCTATSIWKVFQPSCWFHKRSNVWERDGTAAVLRRAIAERA